MKLKKKYHLLDPLTPVVYADGSKIYARLARTYIRHDKGYFVLAPSGSGKTHFVKSQKNKHWLDGDELWMLAKSHPEGEWWLKNIEEIIEIERRSDVITAEAKKLGFWIIGADNYDLVPDAIVLPDWETHKEYIRKREESDYDGGATSDQLERVKKARKWIARHTKFGVPQFKSVQEAAEYLASKA